MQHDKNTAKCFWAYRLEILGLVLIVIATILTIITANSLGITAMLIVGAALCSHKHIYCRSSACETSCADDGSCEDTVVKTVKKAPAKK